MTNSSEFFVVGTPIGNLEDISLRALRILKEVDFVLAEDTRNTKKLLSHFDIHKKTISFHEYSEDKDYEKVFELLRQNKKLALVTDAGTPGISDPGSFLIKKIRENLPDTKIVSIPGPSALISAISISGIKQSKFYFAGFAPHKKGRETFFKEIKDKIDDENAFVFFESTHRLIKALESLQKFCPTNEITVAKELTKIHEGIFTDSAENMIKFFTENPDKTKGEFVIIVS